MSSMSSCAYRVSLPFECRSVSEFSGGILRHDGARFSCKLGAAIGKRPFVRQLSNKARRNFSNIGITHIVAASLPDNQAAEADDAAVVSNSPIDVGEDVVDNNDKDLGSSVQSDQALEFVDKASILQGDGSVAIPAAVNTSAHLSKETLELIDFKKKRGFSYGYGRNGSLITGAVEERISTLEGAESTLLLGSGSGMCATSVMMLALIPAGGHIITTTDCYRKLRIFIETVLPKTGITATVIDPADYTALESALDKHKVSLFFTESPTNLFLRCVDIELVSKLCHSKGAIFCIDGTLATPINQKVLTRGADVVLHSARKYLGGHNDVLAGSVSGSTEIISRVRNLHPVLGGTISPHAAYLLARGMKTLELRVEQQNHTAERMAKVLEAHPKVKHVYYPGLQSHPDHHIAKKQMIGFGGVVSFELDGDLLTTRKFVDALKIPYSAPSFGGYESIVDQPALMSYWDFSQPNRAKYGIVDNLVRFSFGVEYYEDLKADVLQALEMI